MQGSADITYVYLFTTSEPRSVFLSSVVWQSVNKCDFISLYNINGG